MTTSAFGKLREQISTYFNLGELHNLCFDLAINHEILPGTNLEEKSRELISYCFRHGNIKDLVTRCEELRPHVSWQPFEMTSSKSGQSSEPLPQQIVMFSFLRQWKPNNAANGFGADILLESDLDKEGIISFIRYLTTEFVRYANSKDAPILIKLWANQEGYEQDQRREFSDEFKQGYLVFYVKNLTGKGAYTGFNEVRWMQQQGNFSNLYGQITKL